MTNDSRSEQPHRVLETTVAVSINSNYLNKGWLTFYGLLMRQAENGEPVKADVIKACKRVLEDLEPVEPTNKGKADTQ